MYKEGFLKNYFNENSLLWQMYHPSDFEAEMFEDPWSDEAIALDRRINEDYYDDMDEQDSRSIFEDDESDDDEVCYW